MKEEKEELETTGCDCVCEGDTCEDRDECDKCDTCEDCECTESDPNVPLTEEEEKKLLIEQFNTHNEGVFKMSDRIPTEEDVLKAKTDWEEASKVHMEGKFFIADEANAERVAKFLKTWNENDVAWERDMWQGTIFFDEIITKFLESLKEGPKAFEIDYGTLTYLYIGMMNVKGVGLAEAKHRKEIEEEYSPILDIVAKHVEDFQEKTKHIQKLQDLWSMFEAGYYVELL